MAIFGQWEFECDFDATRLAYERADQGGADDCTCNGCRNFVAARSRVFPKGFLDFLTTLGIDPTKDGEVYHNARLAPGRHNYGGWFHFVGQLNTDGDFGMVDFGSGFTACLSKPGAPALSSLQGLPLVELQFYADAVPWVLDEPEPE
jgi:hypothetical protein